jgi:two-component system sensor histidine kinase and response regulator WspE
MSASTASLGDFSMVELFRAEADTTLATLTSGLLALEGDTTGHAAAYEELMRAAHSLKGAARIVDLPCAVRVAHAMEDCFVAAQRGEVKFTRAHVDQLLAGVDLLTRISKTSEADMPRWESESMAEIDSFLARLSAVSEESPVSAPADVVPLPPESREPSNPTTNGGAAADPKSEARVLRVGAENLNRLLGLAGESLVESRWLRPYGVSVARLKRMHRELGVSLDRLRVHADAAGADDQFHSLLADVHHRLGDCRGFLTERLVELDTFDRRATNLSDRLYGEAVAVRMRPFADGIAGFPRMVRDIARQLGKEVRYEVIGEDTPVDREIVEKLEAPLGHLLRNALDHGIESPDERRAVGKSDSGVVRVEARHLAGFLMISVSDDGRGADIEKLRAAVLRRNLVAADMAPKLSEAELLEFLFLPGFSMKEKVTDISGRGVGLDVVQSMVRAVRGSIRVTSTPGNGMKFHLQLPLTLSVVRAMLVEVDGEPYALPLGYITRALRVRSEAIVVTQNLPHFEFDGRRIGLATARQVLGRPAAPAVGEAAVVVLGASDQSFGLVVDKFLGERELVVQPLDPRLGKVRDVAAGAFTEDGAPVLIFDVDDLAHSVGQLAAAGRLVPSAGGASIATGPARKRILVIDDSLTVRELERKLLESQGFVVETAVDGVDGLTAARYAAFDLVITDVDMPRLDGIELTRQLKADTRLKNTPVMIVSYKDREEDRMRGLEAGADYYLTKGSFRDDTMLNAVKDLIGAAEVEALA